MVRVRSRHCRLRLATAATFAAIPGAALAAPAPTAHTLYTACTLTPPRLHPAPWCQVVIFSKTTCPFCRKTKDLFDGLEVKYTAVEIDEMDNGPDVQDALLDSSGQRTVPDVVI